MKQLNIFQSDAADSGAVKKKAHQWKIYVDGASRGNPGDAGAGIYVIKDNQFFAQYGFYLGKKTNNQAEYLALLLALFVLRAKVQPFLDIVHIISDSQLLIRQMQGEYKVKNEDLKVLYEIGKRWLTSWKVTLSHVLREENVEADEMANAGIDKKRKPPQAFIEELNREKHTL